MAAQIIDGKALSKVLRQQYKTRVEALGRAGVVPGLAVILVGDNPASQVYVGNKVKACTECGVRSFHHALPSEASRQEVLDTIARLNAVRWCTASWCSCPCFPPISTYATCWRHCRG